MSEDAEETEDTLTVELNLSDVHEEIRNELEEAGVPVEQQVAQELQPQAEEVLHRMYQQGRYSEGQ